MTLKVPINPAPGFGKVEPRLGALGLWPFAKAGAPSGRLGSLDSSERLRHCRARVSALGKALAIAGHGWPGGLYTPNRPRADACCLSIGEALSTSQTQSRIGIILASGTLSAGGHRLVRGAGMSTNGRKAASHPRRCVTGKTLATFKLAQFELTKCAVLDTFSSVGRPR